MLGGSLGGSMVDPAAFRNYLLSLSPLSMWALDETSGTAAVDYGSLGNNGVYQTNSALAQPSLLPNKYGGSAYFNGALTPVPYVEIPTSASYDTGTLTILLLFQNNTNRANGSIINWRDASNTEGFSLQGAGTGNGVTMKVWDTAYKDVNVAAANGTPYLIICRVDGSNSKVAITDLSAGTTATNSTACGNMLAPNSSPKVRIGMQSTFTPGTGADTYVQLATWIGSAISDAQVADIQRLAKQL